MKKADRQIKFHMTPSPHCIEPHQSLTLAESRMRELGVHHLPVRSGGRILGMLTEGDFAFLKSFKGFSFEKGKVAEAMRTSIVVTPPDASITSVANQILKERQDCAVVTDDAQNVLGIFTSTDALRLLTEAFKE